MRVVCPRREVDDVGDRIPPRELELVLAQGGGEAAVGVQNWDAHDMTTIPERGRHVIRVPARMPGNTCLSAVEQRRPAEAYPVDAQAARRDASASRGRTERPRPGPGASRVSTLAKGRSTLVLIAQATLPMIAGGQRGGLEA